MYTFTRSPDLLCKNIWKLKDVNVEYKDKAWTNVVKLFSWLVANYQLHVLFFSIMKLLVNLGRLKLNKDKCSIFYYGKHFFLAKCVIRNS